MKGKINQSMGFGVPVVASSMAIEGMELRNGEDVLCADTPESFADAVVALYESEELWSKLSTNGLENVKQNYSIQAARKQLQRLVAESLTTRSENARLIPATNSLSQKILATDAVTAGENGRTR